MCITPYVQDQQPNPTQDAGLAVEISAAALLNVCISTNSICSRSTLTGATICPEQHKPGRDRMEGGFQNETPYTKCWKLWLWEDESLSDESHLCSVDLTVEKRSQHLSCDHALKINWSGQDMGEPVSMVVIQLRLLPCAQSGGAIFAAVLCVLRVQSHQRGWLSFGTFHVCEEGADVAWNSVSFPRFVTASMWLNRYNNIFFRKGKL